MFQVEEMKPDHMRHFGIMVRDEAQLAEVRDNITTKYGLKSIPGLRYDVVVSENSNEPNQLILWGLRAVLKSSLPKQSWSFPTDREIVLL